MYIAKSLATVALVTMVIAASTRSAAAQEGIPHQLTAIRDQLTAIQTSLSALPDQQSALAAIQTSLTAISTSISALQQSLANVDPTVSRDVVLGSGNTYAATGTSLTCAVQNVSASTVSVTATQLNILGQVLQSTTFNLAPGNGNGFSIVGSGGSGGTAFRWCKFEYTGPANAVRGWLSAVNFATGIEYAIHEAR